MKDVKLVLSVLFSYFLPGALALFAMHVLLTAASATAAAPQPDTTTVTLSCTPTRDLLLGVDDAGKTTSLENWSALCVMSDTKGRVLGKWAFQPTTQVPQTQDQAAEVGRQVVQGVRHYLHDQRYSDGNL